MAAVPGLLTNATCFATAITLTLFSSNLADVPDTVSPERHYQAIMLQAEEPLRFD